MLMPKKDAAIEETLDDVSFHWPLAIVTGTLIGAAAGIIGQGGGFLYVPAILYLLKIPTRICIGSALAIGILSSGAVLSGAWAPARFHGKTHFILVVGVIVGAQLGSC